MLYQNISKYKKTFYGVEFKAGDIKDVPGYINDPDFKRVYHKPSTSTTSKTTNTVVKESVNKKQEVKDGSDNSK